MACRFSSTPILKTAKESHFANYADIDHHLTPAHGELTASLSVIVIGPCYRQLT
jgi:hypothetical protein